MTHRLGAVPLDQAHFEKAASFFPFPEIPWKVVVPQRVKLLAALLVRKQYGELAIGVELAWHEASDSWALLNDQRVVMAEWPPATHHRFPGRGQV